MVWVVTVWVTVLLARQVSGGPVTMVAGTVWTGVTLSLRVRTQDGVVPGTFDAFQVRVVESPAFTRFGAAVSDMTAGPVQEVGGGAAALTVTVADFEALPPGPVQVAVYEVVVPGETSFVPEVPLPETAVPEHEVAFVEDQVSVEDPPLVMVDGDAVRVTVGVEPPAETMTVTDFEALPPGPVQVAVYEVLEPGETTFVPDVALPVTAVPEHEVAFVEDQVSVEDPPLVMVDGDAVRETVGVGSPAEHVMFEPFAWSL